MRRLIETGSWEHGYLLDRWSVSHFALGLGLAFLFRTFQFSKTTGLVLSVAVMLGWEIYERIKGVYEPIPNSILDVVVGVLAFLFVWHVSQDANLALDVILMIISFGVVIVIKWVFAPAQ